MSEFEYDWRADAACWGYDPERWFPVGTQGPAVRQEYEAKAICRDCPVQVDCLEYALAYGMEGIWGGLNDEERRAARLTGSSLSA